MIDGSLCGEGDIATKEDDIPDENRPSGIGDCIRGAPGLSQGEANDFLADRSVGAANPAELTNGDCRGGEECTPLLGEGIPKSRSSSILFLGLTQIVPNLPMDQSLRRYFAREMDHTDTFGAELATIGIKPHLLSCPSAFVQT